LAPGLAYASAYIGAGIPHWCISTTPRQLLDLGCKAVKFKKTDEHLGDIHILLMYM
jgi:hypothetical protein